MFCFVLFVLTSLLALAQRMDEKGAKVDAGKSGEMIKAWTEVGAAGMAKRVHI